jgi:secreted PhoX family phosphatase
MAKPFLNKKNLFVPILSAAVLMTSAVPSFAAAKGTPVVTNIEYIGMNSPTTAEDIARSYTGASVKVTYSDGTTKTSDLSYKTLFKSTDKFNGIPAGAPIDANGKVIMDNSVAGQSVPFVSDSPDSNGLLKIAGQTPTGKGGNPLSLITHFEYITSDNANKSAYGIVPASENLSTIDQNKTTGELSVTNMKKIDFSAVDGLWIPCNGSVTPWNTFLSSEEYEPNAIEYEKDATKTSVSSFTKYYYQSDSKKGNPYLYGYLPEITVNADSSTSVVKHYSMGRFSHELGKVAPDHKTVFFGDDGKNTMLFMYIADHAQDLTVGTLYAAKWIQKTDTNGGSADLQWIKLGHASDKEIKSYIDQGLKFSDMFEVADKPTEGFTAINSYPLSKMEYIKVKKGMEKAAAFLESRRYGALLGATSEFSKMEGISVNAKDKKAYVVISYLKDGMLKDTKNEYPHDDMQLAKIEAGATYELSLMGGQKDSSGSPIQTQYAAANMSALVVGEDLPKPDAFGNTANVDKVANPDNISYSEATRTLFIGEDSGTHSNNFVWAYNIDTKKLSRILSVASGAEATGLAAIDNMNGFSYIMSNLQHPGDAMLLPEPLKSQVDALINANYDNKRAGLVGYISGIPMTNFGESTVVIRDLVEQSGATVSWDPKTMTATIEKGMNTLVLQVGASEVVWNGNTVPLDNKLVLAGARLVVPQHIAEDYLNYEN